MAQMIRIVKAVLALKGMQTWIDLFELVTVKTPEIDILERDNNSTNLMELHLILF